MHLINLPDKTSYLKKKKKQKKLRNFILKVIFKLMV